MSDLLYSITDLSYSYPGHGQCLGGVTFDIKQGERVALIGANGSGKSTLLHILDGLYFADSGSVEVMGQRLAEESVETPPFGPRFRKEVGFLFQNSDAQLFCATVEEELAFAPLQLRWPREEIYRRITDTLELLEISHLRDRTPQALSSGEKKRVALASVLVVSPSVLLLDEPTAGLDPRSQSILLEILFGLHQAGMTIVTATHELALLDHLADRAIVLGEDHQIAADAPVHDILHNTDLLLSVNLIHAHTHSHGGTVHSHPHDHSFAHDHQHSHE